MSHASLVALLAVGLVVLLSFNIFSIVLGILSLAVVAIYPFAKRFTDWPQFFLGMAQAWCERRRPEYSRLLINVDPHSPAEFRVNGPLSNMPEFFSAWQCAPTAKMIRKNQCQVW